MVVGIRKISVQFTNAVKLFHIFIFCVQLATKKYLDMQHGIDVLARHNDLKFSISRVKNLT